MFARLLSSSIWVIVSSTLTVRLTDVLGRKRAVNFIFLVITLYSHPHGHLQPRLLIGSNNFFFWEVGTIARHRC
jgi:hypothetical protein